MISSFERKTYFNILAKKFDFIFFEGKILFYGLGGKHIFKIW